MSSHAFPLIVDAGHLFLDTGADQWLIDTGAPQSFGDRELDIGDGTVRVASSLMGLDARQLERLVGRPVAGLLGGDILNLSDWLFDVPGGQLIRGGTGVELSGTTAALDFVMGVPVVTATVAGQDRRLFLDSGAQLSYLVDESLDVGASDGSRDDFFPGVGKFQTPVWRLPIELQGLQATCEFGRLPPMLEMTLALAGADGILGNALMLGRRTAYLPTRRRVVFE